MGRASLSFRRQDSAYALKVIPVPSWRFSFDRRRRKARRAWTRHGCGREHQVRWCGCNFL